MFRHKIGKNMALLYTYTFQTDTLLPGLTLGANGSESLASSSYPYGIEDRLEPSIAPDGSKALLSRITGNDAETSGAIRSEASVDKGPALTGVDRERWYTLQVWIPSTHTPNVRTSFMQIHDDPDDGEGVVKSPNLEFIVFDGIVHIDLPKDCPTEQAGYRPLPGIALKPDRWVDIVLHAFWETDSTAFLEVAYDGIILSKEWNRANHYPDIKQPYIKFGLYDTYHGGIVGDYSVWYRNLKIWGGRHPAQEVLGTVIKPRVTRVE